jgi:hypothetical protein
VSAACLSDLVLSARAQRSARAHWLSDPDLGQHSHARLNKGEASNSVHRAVFFHRQGEIRGRTFENQSFHASGLSMITAAIVHWNTVFSTAPCGSSPSRRWRDLPPVIVWDRRGGGNGGGDARNWVSL